MKITRFLLLLLLLFNHHLLYAHAVVTHSTLNVNAIAANHATQVELTFNSRIELNLSQVFLVSTGDIKQTIETEAGQKPGTILVNLPPLQAGEYALQLKVFAADGHLSEDLIRFFVSK